MVLGLQGAIDAGAIAKQPVEPFASFLLGGLIETAMRIVRARKDADTMVAALRGLARSSDNRSS